jgi:hypothetical protein
MDSPDDDGWQWQAECEEQQQIELNERTGAKNERSNFDFGRKRDRQVNKHAQSGPGADPFDSGY